MDDRCDRKRTVKIIAGSPLLALTRDPACAVKVVFFLTGNSGKVPGPQLLELVARATLL